ncbi:MAG: N-acetyltransferase [Ignavibacteria bacterium CG_4_8_14_3_um_filter_37_9]|nr:GNAT family N-acetyltransferase [Ignavibacteria bacterium]OIO17699.1 MAG: GNAT family N-acetyltransferase [Ignavibacteria bacterium CG1_02_37_35]PIP79640.1 MAG: GNAT family N-acetyltransferase [Ignavibacteria bacterium CG22_combo_CG10-13_8_21_14_all_37_15]PIS44496.1 MAG: N-acetyltransferase [Ignavibacteria bacterium CG08_land_8_20_14_0_20_37_9]PIW97962.1 MAG: N-acetyltransferase [Ignavibacteria bacterium CG_4_8_14_3_um_filter_37_9]PIX94383.1 MAG: N-acetyltransferase [Ignavibacteria bacteriu
MIRKLKQADRPSLETILRKTKNFHAEEVDVALELIDIALLNNGQSDYHIFVSEEHGKISGYHCTGKRPLTDGVYDLYWIVVDPESSGKGIGKKLVQHAENFVRGRNARWLLAETSSKELYLATQKFYFKNEFSIVAKINDFYAVGDALLVFGKYLLNK